ncbi:hypothetical protein B0H10DRAFT_1668019, partial [Mycena sp. CBHHK59/15]
ARWTTDFLPTLYCKLGATDSNPWDLPGGDVQFIQEVWDDVYPNSGYKVTLGCPAKDRLNDKHSFFGRRGETVVAAKFLTEEFIGNPKKIGKYAKYALRDDGPGIWGTPTPANVKRGEPGYTEPEGVFTADPVIAVYAPFVKSTAGSVRDFGFTGTALALSLAGLERAWLKRITGSKVDDGTPFSREQVSGLVEDYSKSVGKLTPRRWKLILDKCDAYNLADAPLPVSASTMETNRHQLFIPSS